MFNELPSSYWLFGFIVLAGMFLSVRASKLTVPAAVTGGLISIFIYLGAEFIGIAMMGTFFLLASLATSWQIEKKKKIGVAEKEGGRRTSGQVIANGGVAALCGLLVFIMPEYKNVFAVMMAASLSSATADTLSSELGTLYGKRFYNIKTFKKDQRGLNGVISIEGCLIGVAGSIIIALIYAISAGFNYAMVCIIVAGTVGNLVDSLLGATLERKHMIGNNAVNFINTLVAAVFAWLLIMV